MHLRDRPNRAAANEFNDAAIVGRGVDLRAHLRCDAGRLGGLGNQARLVDIVRQRLLAINMLAGAKCRQGGIGVRMLRSANDKGVEIVHLRMKLAKVAVRPSLRKERRRAFEVPGIDIAKCNDLVALRSQLAEIPSTAASHPNKAQPQTIVRRAPGGFLGATKARKHQSASRDRRRAQKCASIHGRPPSTQERNTKIKSVRKSRRQSEAPIAVA
jgi:hypothetical protein